MSRITFEDLHVHFTDIAAELAVDGAEAARANREVAPYIRRAVARLLEVLSRTIPPADLHSKVDDNGRARAGSQLQVQLYVNKQPDVLAHAIIDACPELAQREPHVVWRSPLTQDRYAEYRDRAFLAALGLHDHVDALREFWPGGGPRWDGLAHRDFADGNRGVLLVEAEAHPLEVLGPGCGATDVSLQRTEARLDRLKQRLGVAPDIDWLGPYYQSANRLAHLFFLRDRGVDAWLANVYFVDDWYGKTGRQPWDLELAKQKEEFGLRDVPSTIDVFVRGLPQTAHSLE